MNAGVPQDEAEKILRDCREKLSRIRLDLPEIDPTVTPPPRAKLPPPRASPPPRARTLDWIKAHRSHCAATLGAVLVLVAWMMLGGRGELTLTLADGDALAVRAETNDLLVAAGGSLLRLNAQGKILETLPFSAPACDLAWSSGSLWSVDGRAPAVTERAERKAPSVFALNHVPTSIHVHGNSLWTVEKDGRSIKQFMITRSLLGTFLQALDIHDLGALQPESFDVDESGLLWLVDAPTRRLYKLKASSGAYRAVAWAPLMPLIGPSGRVRGLTVQDEAVWLLQKVDGERGAVLHRLPLRRLDWTAS